MVTNGNVVGSFGGKEPVERSGVHKRFVVGDSECGVWVLPAVNVVH